MNKPTVNQVILNAPSTDKDSTMTSKDIQNKRAEMLESVLASLSGRYEEDFKNCANDCWQVRHSLLKENDEFTEELKELLKNPEIPTDIKPIYILELVNKLKEFIKFVADDLKYIAMALGEEIPNDLQAHLKEEKEMLEQTLTKMANDENL